MTAGARFAAILGAAAISGVALAHVRTHAQQTPAQTFRTTTDVVLVDVSVMDRGQPVTGLTADDFVLTDNGVRQRIDSVEPTAVPIDLTLVVDVSGNPRSPWRAAVSPGKVAAEVEAEVASVARVLRPEDRLRVLAVDTHVQEVWPMQAGSVAPSLPRLEAGGLSALYDALAAALLHPVEPARRHVVVARTKGVDTISSVDAATVQAIAERADALLHVVAMEDAGNYDLALSAFQCREMGFCWPGARFWVPFERRLMVQSLQRLLPDGQALANGAEATGGSFHQAGLLRVPTLTRVFRQTFDQFRSGYLLRYSPSGGPRPGWHDIEVRVPRSRSYRVRARSGYLVEETAPPPAPPPVPKMPRTLDELTRAYEARDYGRIVYAVRQADDPLRLLREFEENGNPWPANPRREAAFALELVEPLVFAADERERDAGLALLRRFSLLVRQPLGPDDFERYWYFAALTLLEGTLRPDVIDAFAARALARFPDEPRFMLSRAIAADVRRMRDKSAPADEPIDPRELYANLVDQPTTATEARIRLARLLVDLGRPEEALEHLEAAGRNPAAEVWLRYLRCLFLGRVLNALDRREAAAAAFREALDLIPAAQSARVELMNTLLLAGDRAGAEALADAIQRETDATIDPWWMYWTGQYRLQPQAMARLREMIE